MSDLVLPWTPAMETHSVMRGQDNCGLDTSLAGAQAEPVSHTGDRPYPPGMGLRPKACPPSRRESSPVTRSERPWQGQVDRCLTLLRTWIQLLEGMGALVQVLFLSHPLMR